MLTPSRRSLLVVAAGALLVPTASAQAKARVHYPKVTGVAPLKVTIGQRLTLTGSGFRTGRNRMTVVFGRVGKPSVFTKASASTTSRLTVTVPPKVVAFLGQSQGQRLATHFRLRVIGTRSSEHWTGSALSPLVRPTAALTTVATAIGGPGAVAPSGPTLAGPAAGVPIDAYLACEQGAAATPSADADADGLANATELAAKLDPCNPDTDGDAIPDGYEYQAAKDLGGQNVPYAGKRPFPNPLDSSDANFDFDGDGLSMAQEYVLWKYLGSQFTSAGHLANYSDGTQNTGGALPVTTSAMAQLDINGDGTLTDDERDADSDGLSNIVEDNYTGTQGWWAAVHTDEKAYAPRPFADLNAADPDTDGNGVVDGADDQDQDGFDNSQEMQLGRVRTGLRVQPFNPCLPNPHALTCSRYIPVSNAWPPFDGSQRVGDETPFLFPRPATQGVVANPWDGTGGA